MNNQLHHYQLKHPCIYHSYHIFPHSLDIVWKIISDISLITVIEDQKTLKRYYPNINLTFSEGYRISIDIDQSLKVYYKIVAIEETDYCCSLIWKGYLANTSIELFESVFNLHHKSEYETKLVTIYKFPFKYRQFIKEEYHRQAYYSLIDHFISSKEYLKVHTDTRVIKGRIQSGMICIFNFVSCLDMVFDNNNGSLGKAGLGMIVSSNISKAQYLGEKMELINKLVKIEKSDNKLLMVTHGYDKTGKLPYRCSYLELLSSDEDEENNNELYCNSDEGNCLKKRKKNEFLVTFRHIFVSELNEQQMKYTSFYKDLFISKFVKIVGKIEEKNHLVGIKSN